MYQPLSRRRFLNGAAGAALAALGPGDLRLAAQPPASPFKKALLWDMLPKNLPVEERFRLCRAVGFEGVEFPPVADAEEAKRMRAAAEAAGVRIHSVIYGGWHLPLSSPDPAVQERGVRDAQNAIRSAKNLGADDILLVPAVVNAGTRYRDAYERSQRNVLRLVPLAERLEVQVLIEEVWNNFLLSPIEFARYVDSFHSRWVQAYFDVGNVVAFGWPEDWIRTLGRRIKKVHLKDYKGGPGLGGNGQFVALREGSINWPEVRKAFLEIGYSGFMTVELGGGDADYLREVSARVDKIYAGA